MRKALIIANMLFASATVFGMDSKSIKTEGLSAISQSKSSSQISSIRDISQSENMTQMSLVKDKQYKLFKIAQSEIKNADWLSEDAKLLYSELRFEDVWKQIEVVFSSSLNRSDTDFFDRILGNIRASKEYVDVVEKVKNNAKRFYKQVLGSSELGKVLYEKAVETIDAGNYIQCSDLASIKNSFFKLGEKITVRYYTADDFLLTLIHETGHALDYHYRSINRLSESTVQQREYVPIFFETLLEGKNFRGNLYSQDYSLHGLRIGEVYLDLLKKNVINALITSYDKENLFKFCSEYFQPSMPGKKENELDRILEDLEHNPKTKIFIDAFHDLYDMGMSFTPNYDRDDNQKEELEWRNCLKMLEDIQGYDDLKQFLRDANIGKGPYFEVIGTNSGCSGYFSTLRVGYQSKKRIDFPPELDKIDWIQIFLFASKKVQDFKFGFEKAMIAANYVAKSSENTNSWELWNFLDNSTKLKFLEVLKIIAPYAKMLNKRMGLKFQEYMIGKSIDTISSMLNISNLDNHTEGKYNSFRLIKEKGYLNMLEKGESLPIEEIMQELTKQAEPLNLTEESVDEFFEFLKK